MKVKACSRFLAVRHPTSADPARLLECLNKQWICINIPEADCKAKLVGYDCDGANVSIACNGLKGYFEEAVLLIMMFWCLTHCLELAMKDALKSTLFNDIRR